ncbi:MAG: ribosome maturation factor RimP [Methylophilaceae bacterium]
MNTNLEEFVSKIVAQMGYELVDFEFQNQGKLIRIFIDKPASVTIDDCVDVSNHLNHVLTVEEDIDYERLEVSSPGFDRVIKKIEDFQKFKGENIKIKTRTPIMNQRNFKGEVLGVKGLVIMIKTPEQEEVNIDFDNIDRARLDPKI